MVLLGLSLAVANAVVNNSALHTLEGDKGGKEHNQKGKRLLMTNFDTGVAEA